MDLTKINAGKNIPFEVNTIIEIPQDSSVKYELDKESGALVVDRFSFSALSYPFNYGFIPHTMAEDNDPVDVLVLSSYPLFPLSVISVRPVGMLEMEDEAGVDAKIIAVGAKKVDPFFAHIENIEDVDEATKNKIKHMFEHYKDLEPGKWAKIKNFLPKEKAYEIIKKSLK